VLPSHLIKTVRLRDSSFFASAAGKADHFRVANSVAKNLQFDLPGEPAG
jgi:hypothetical protein